MDANIMQFLNKYIFKFLKCCRLCIKKKIKIIAVTVNQLRLFLGSYPGTVSQSRYIAVFSLSLCVFLLMPNGWLKNVEL